MTRLALSLVALVALLCAGCFFGPRNTPAAPKYTLADSPTAPVAQDLLPSVRLAVDLRAAPAPLHFHADGTVTPIEGLTYYAPLEVAIEAALRSTTAYTPNQPPRRASITVLAFCLDERSGSPLASVRLATSAPNGAQREVSASRPLPASPSPRVLRDALAQALLEAYAELAR